MKNNQQKIEYEQDQLLAYKKIMGEEIERLSKILRQKDTIKLNKIHQLQDAVERRQKQIKQLGLLFQERQIDIQFLRNNMNTWRKQNQDLRNTNTQLQNQLQKIEFSFYHENRRYKDQLKSKEKELNFHVERFTVAAQEVQKLKVQNETMQMSIQKLSNEVERLNNIIRKKVEELIIINAKNGNSPNKTKEINQYERERDQMIRRLKENEAKQNYFVIELQRLSVYLHAQQKQTSSMQPLLKRNQYLQSTNKILEQQRVNALQKLSLAREENNIIQRKYSDINKQCEKLDQQLKRTKEFAQSKEKINQMEVYELNSLKIREGFHLKEQQLQKHIEYLSNNYCELQKICREFDGSKLPNSNKFLQFSRQYRQHRLKIIRESLILVHDEGWLQDSLQFVDLLKELNNRDSTIK